MSDLSTFVDSNIGPIVGLLGLLVGLVMAVASSWRAGWRASRGGWRRLTRGEDGRSLEAVLDAHLDKVYAVAREVERPDDATDPPRAATQRRAFQRHGLVRFNPFEDTGGNQSFALVLLDAQEDGSWSAASTARVATRVYAQGGGRGRSESAALGRGGGGAAPAPVAPGAARRLPVAARDIRAGRTRGILAQSPAASPARRRPPLPRAAVRRGARPGATRRRWPDPRRADDGPGADPEPGATADRAFCAPRRVEREQARGAVTHGDGPLLVVAGAGTGKTQVITRRIAWLIATRRARPSEILALTFTERAAEEMQERVDRLVPYGYADS